MNIDKFTGLFRFSVLGLLLFVTSCKKGIDTTDDTMLHSLKKWIGENGQVFSNEKVSVDMGSKEVISANLQWNRMKRNDKNGYSYYTIPFDFERSNTKSNRINYQISIDENPSLWNVVIRVDEDQKMEGRFVISSFNNQTHNGVRQKELVQTVYDLAVNLKLTTLKINDNPTIFLLDKPKFIASTPAYNCELTSFVTKVVDCSGTNQFGVVCTLKSRTTSRYRCEFSSNVEEEEVQWTLEGCSCGDGWFEYEEEDEEYENQEIIDSLSAFPCTQDILKQLPSFNDEARKLIDSVFGHNDNFNLTYSVDPTLGKDSLLNGYYKFQGTLNANFFNGTIRMNPWVLQNSSREFIAATLLHESIHAVVSYWYTRYRIHNIDSIQFKNMFPIFWDYQSQKDMHELAEHSVIAADYVNLITAFIKRINPSVDDSMAEALAWKGLQETSVWMAKPDKNTILNKIRIARRDLDSTTYLHYNLTTCPD